MNALVYAQIVKAHADAQLKVERLQAKLRSTPNIARTSDGRLSLFRTLTEAQDQALSWYAVMTAALSLDDGFDERSVPGE